MLPNFRVNVSNGAYWLIISCFVGEIYKFLSTECKAYLDNNEAMTIWHLRDLASGKKKKIKYDQVRTIMIPMYNGLKVDLLLHYAY